MSFRLRGPRALLLLVVFLGTVSSAPAASADTTKDDLARARDKLAAAQTAADEAAAKYEAALSGRAQLEQQLGELSQRIDAAQAREAALEKTVQQIALRAYMGAGEPVVGSVLFSGEDLLDIGRSARLLDRANAPNIDAIDELSAVRADLGRDQSRVTAAKQEAEHLVADLGSESQRVQDELASAESARRDIEARFSQEQQAKAIAAARAAAVAAQQQRVKAATVSGSAGKSTSPSTRPSSPPRTSSTTPHGNPSTGPASPPPVSSHIVCPVRGAVSFIDSFGAPRSGGRSHQGVDMMAAEGTPNVATVSGTVRQQQGALQGNGVFLSGDDGNSYWYFHLSRYEGPPRHVSQGEVIGYTGHTGNADGGAPHTHFEYHPGGGAAVDPYPLVRAAC
jgi:murein DD-endopeptidase MepM/ murein hydrolase activator NlpD